MSLSVMIGPFRVEYDYTPPEREYFSGRNGIGNPGCDEEFTPTRIYGPDGKDITDLVVALGMCSIIHPDSMGEDWTDVVRPMVAAAHHLRAEQQGAEAAWERMAA